MPKMWNKAADNGAGAWVEVPDELFEARWREGYQTLATEQIRIKVPLPDGGWKYGRVPASSFSDVLRAGGSYETLEEFYKRRDESEWGGTAGQALAVPLGIGQGLAGSGSDLLISKITGMSPETIERIADFHPATTTAAQIAGFGVGGVAGATMRGPKILAGMSKTQKAKEVARGAALLVPGVAAGKLGRLTQLKVGRAAGVTARAPGLGRNMGLTAAVGSAGAVEGAVWRTGDLIGEELLGRSDRSAGELLREVGTFGALTGAFSLIGTMALGGFDYSFRLASERAGAPFGDTVAKKIDEITATLADGDTVQAQKLLEKLRSHPEYIDELMGVDDALHATAEGYAEMVNLASRTVSEAQKMHGSNYKSTRTYELFVDDANIAARENTGLQITRAGEVVDSIIGGADELTARGAAEGTAAAQAKRHFADFKRATLRFRNRALAQVVSRMHMHNGMPLRLWRFVPDNPEQPLGAGVWKEAPWQSRMKLTKTELETAKVQFRDNVDNVRGVHKDLDDFLNFKQQEKGVRGIERILWENKATRFTWGDKTYGSVKVSKKADSLGQGFRSINPERLPAKIKQLSKAQRKAAKDNWKNNEGNVQAHYSSENQYKKAFAEEHVPQLDDGMWEWAARNMGLGGEATAKGVEKGMPDFGAWLFTGLDDLKRTLRKHQNIAEASGELRTLTKPELNALGFGRMSKDLTDVLESVSIWGAPAKLQQGVNKSWNEFLGYWKPFKVRFSKKKEHRIKGGRVGDVDAIKTYLKKKSEEQGHRLTEAHRKMGYGTSDHVSTQMMEDTVRSFTNLIRTYQMHYNPKFGDGALNRIKSLKGNEQKLIERINGKKTLEQLAPDWGLGPMKQLASGAAATMGLGATILPGGFGPVAGVTSIGFAALVNPMKAVRVRAAIQISLSKAQKRLDNVTLGIAEKVTGKRATGLRAQRTRGINLIPRQIPELSKVWHLRTPIIGPILKLGHEEPDKRKNRLSPTARNAQSTAKAIAQIAGNPKYLEHLLDSNLAAFNGAPKIQEEMRGKLQQVFTYLDSNQPAGMHQTMSALGAEPEFMTTDAAADEYLQMVLTAASPVEMLGQSIGKGTLTPVVITTMKNLYPDLLDEIRAKVLDQLAGKEVSHNWFGQLSILFERPFSPFHDGAALKVLQSLYMKSDPRPNKGSMRALKNTAENVMPHTQRIV